MRTQNKDSAGISLINMESWKKHYMVLLTEDRTHFILMTIDERSDSGEVDTPSMTSEEIHKAAKVMRNGKAPSPDITNCISTVRVGSAVSSEFPVSKELQQGCNIAPTLFKIYLKEALKIWKSKCSNMRIPVGDDIYNILFADNQVIIAGDELYAP
ncbi:hypothetical protein ILUMI_01112 [Ignelater luminosus]|uniref:Reverse transcriptase domain-containing protein n=1 Tax=Ignelater luminosus TaxID=2038154 RepID=A0A8K0GM08_IGNLU|nr:hypothetical protein ILUMI_01112 [Ignelater luminosus]